MTIKNQFYLCFCLSICLFCHQSIGMAEIQVDDDVLIAIEDNYRLYRARNARKAADHEINAQIPRRVEHFQRMREVSLPICDFERPPFLWKFVPTGENESVLKYMGESGGGSQFLRWTETAWVHIAGPQGRYREGMYCGPRSYVAIGVDKSLSESSRRRTSPAETSGTVILQLGSKAFSENPRSVRAEVEIAVDTVLPIRVNVEIWGMQRGQFELLNSSWEFVGNGIDEPQLLHVVANAGAQVETLLVLRLDPEISEKAANGKSFGHIYLLGASLKPTDVESPTAL